MLKIGKYRGDTCAYISVILFVFTLLACGFLVFSRVSAETTTVDTSVNVPESCSLSGTGMNSHNADVPNGTYQADIGITTLKAMCNDSEGFAIYAIGYTGDQYSGDDHTKLIGTNTNQKITTSTATSGNTSSWAMKLTAVSSPTPVYPITLDNGYGSYSSIPDTYTKVAHRDSGTDVGTNATGAQLTTTYASFISSTQTADNYSGKVKYTLVHPSDEEPLQPQPATSGYITYHPNAGTVEGTMGRQEFHPALDWSQCNYSTDYDSYCSALEDIGIEELEWYEMIDWDVCYDTDWGTYCYDEYGEEIPIESITWWEPDWSSCYETDYSSYCKMIVEKDIADLPTVDYTKNELLASNYSREGYGFAGWTDTFDYATNPNAHFYGPNETVTLPDTTITSGLSLYAVWVKSAGSLQDTNKVAELCGSGSGSLTAATYSGNSSDQSNWFITADLSSISALTDTRDNQTYAIAKLSDGKCWMIENLRLADVHQEGSNTVSTVITTSNTNNPLNDGTNVTIKHNYSDKITYSTLSPSNTSWCSNDSAECYNQSRLRTNNTTDRAVYAANQAMSANANIYSYGNYYNWYSATAGRGTYDKTSGNTEGDICPTNWRLPTGHSSSSSLSGDFGFLSNSLGGNKASANNQKAFIMDEFTNPTGEIMGQRLRHFPNNYIESGDFSYNSISSRGSVGLYWTSTAYISTFISTRSYAYPLFFNKFSVYPGTTLGSSGYRFDYKHYGYTIRCVANFSQ